MRLLLDTNVFVRFVDGRLDRDLRDALAASGAEVQISVANLWEIAIKVRLGKLPLRVSPEDLPAFIDSVGFALLTIKAPHVLADVDP